MGIDFVGGYFLEQTLFLSLSVADVKSVPSILRLKDAALGGYTRCRRVIIRI